jgi:DNA-binding SARP family transcriptional activator
VEFCVLGPFNVRHDSVVLDLGVRKQRVVLGLLAVQANQLVTLEQIVDELWGEQPPRSAVLNARQYAATLRRLLERAESRSGRIVRAGSGYELRADPGELDLAAYESEVRQGHRALAAADLPMARDLFRQAMARWRGPMLDGLPRGAEVAARCASVEFNHRALAHTLAEIHLQLGEAASAITVLSSLLVADRYRERTYELLMRAHYLHDGVGAAIAVYEAARSTLAEELGVEPGPELRRLRYAVLNRHPDLLPPELDRPATTVSVPRQRRPDERAEAEQATHERFPGRAAR